MSIQSPELALHLDNSTRQNIKPIQIEKKSPYKKMHSLKGFHLGKRFWLTIGTIVISGAITVMKVNASEINTPSKPIQTFIENPLIVDSNASKKVIDYNGSTIEIAREEVKTIDFSYEKRKEEVPTRKYEVNKSYENKMTDELVKLYEKNGSDYGFDPYIFMGTCMNESSLNPNVDSNRHATGICQVENTHIGSVVSAYNYNTGEVDEIKVTVENLNDLETNIKIGSMLFKNRLNKYDDIYLAIQSYNYDSSSIDMLIRVSGLKNPTYEELYPWIEDLHDNPRKYLPDWKYDTYGSKEYVPNVLRYVPGNHTYIVTNQNTIRIYDVDKNELVGEYRVISKDLEMSLLENIETLEHLNVKNINFGMNGKKDYAK